MTTHPTPTRQPIVWRMGVSGSRTWRRKWAHIPRRDFDEQLFRLQPGDTFILRHGHADEGIDRIAHEWFAERSAEDHGIFMVEELVPADWDNCVVEPYTDARGARVGACPTTAGHRRPSKRSTAPDGCICPRAGMLRNPDVVNDPEHPVNVVQLYCVDNSSGTMQTFEHARRHGVNHVLHSFYPKRGKRSEE